MSDLTRKGILIGSHALCLIVGVLTTKYALTKAEPSALQRAEALKRLCLGTFTTQKSFCDEIQKSVESNDLSLAGKQIGIMRDSFDRLISGVEQILPLTEKERNILKESAIQQKDVRETAPPTQEVDSSAMDKTGSQAKGRASALIRRTTRRGLDYHSQTRWLFEAAAGS